MNVYELLDFWLAPYRHTLIYNSLWLLYTLSLITEKCVTHWMQGALCGPQCIQVSNISPRNHYMTVNEIDRESFIV
jgi:hypothetical protein